MATTKRLGQILGLAAVVALSMGGNPSEASPGRNDHAARLGGSKVEADTYVAELTVGQVKAGKEATFEVTLLTKGEYHINKQYPYKVKAQDPAADGVTYPKPVLQRADGSFEEKRAAFKVPFVAAKAGKAHVEATFYVSVCSDSNCVMEKIPLSQDVEVK